MKTFNAVFGILTDSALEILTESIGDLEAYVTSKIEAEINTNNSTTK